MFAVIANRRRNRPGLAARRALGAIALFAATLVVEPAWAQFAGGMQPYANPMGINQAIQNSMGGSQYPGAQGVNPQQMQQMFMLRAMQGLGHHHGVQVGAPIFLNGGPPMMDPTMMGPMQGSGAMGLGAMGSAMGPANGYGAGQPAGSARHRTSAEKLATLRATREQQKVLARDRAAQAKAKKSKPPVAHREAGGVSGGKNDAKGEANPAAGPNREPF